MKLFTHSRKAIKVALTSLFTIIAFSFLLASCTSPNGPDTPGGGQNNPPEKSSIDLSGFAGWSDTTSFNKSKMTITYTEKYGGGCAYFETPKTYDGYNYLELKFESDQIQGIVKAVYSDSKYSYGGIPKGTGTTYIKLEKGKSLREVSIQAGAHIPHNIKIVSAAFCKTLPASYTNPVKDSGSKSLNGTKSAMDFVKDITIGWNLGNSYDGTYYGNKTQAEADNGLLAFTLESDMYWDNEPPSEAMIKEVHSKGFDLLRFPVTWYNHVIDDNYTIDPAWMLKVKQVVDWAINDGMYVMLDEHHSVHKGQSDNIAYGDGYQVSKSSQTESEKFLKRIWAQICEAFNNGYDEHLIFEVLNEPRDTSDHNHAFQEWYKITGEDCAKCKEDAEVLNALNQACVDTIRASGGNNANRYLVIPGLSTSYLTPLLDEFAWPEDTAEDKLILAVHDYYYCLPEEGTLKDEWTSYSVTEENKKTAADNYRKLNERFMSKGIPVILTETSCNYSNSKGVTIDRDVWYDYFLYMLSEYGARVIWWDNGGAGNNGAILNRTTLKWECYAKEGDTVPVDVSDFVTKLTSRAAEVKSAPKEPSQDPSGNPPEPSSLTGTELLSAPVDLGNLWDKSIDIAKNTSDATEDACFKVTITGTGSFRFAANTWDGYSEGVFIGGQPATDTSGGASYGTIFVTNGQTIYYYPGKEGWNKIKNEAKGLIIVGTDLVIQSIIYYPNGNPYKELINDGPVTDNWSGSINIGGNFESVTKDSYLRIEVTQEISMKLTNNSWTVYTDGNLTGAAMNLDDPSDTNNYGLIWAPADSVIFYKPSEAEWAKIKTDGLLVPMQGTIKSIVLFQL